MNNEALIDYLSEVLQRHGFANTQIKVSAVSGGDSHRCFRVSSDNQTMFLKLATQNISAGDPCVLESEYASLSHLNRLFAGNYPSVKFLDIQKQQQCLGLSFFNLTELDHRTAHLAGSLLAKQHSVYGSQYGWYQNNHIGHTVQSNDWSDSWVDFFAEQRLTPQLRLARLRGLDRDIARSIESMLDSGLPILQDRIPEVSLVHGDLWSGNLAMDAQTSRPLMFDPAPYYGDREVDIAMTRLFGRFPAEFYTAYQQQWPLEDGFERREAVYNLYHALNHFNLFGVQYVGLIVGLLRRMSVY